MRFLLLNKSRVTSAIIKKRNILEPPISDNTLTINSPLITNRSKNRLQDLSKAYFEENKTSTPSMPPRSSELVFSKERDENDRSKSDWQRSFQFRSLDRPPLPNKQKEQSKFNTNSSENKKLESTNFAKPKEESKFIQKVVSAQTLSSQIAKPSNLRPLVLNPIKREKFEEIKSSNNEGKSAVSATPGQSKRKLQRDTNLAINSCESQDAPLSLNKIESEEIKDIPKLDIHEIQNKQKEDPLSKFLKPKDEPGNKVKDSHNFLKQLGGVVPFIQRKSEEKKELFQIPEFKPKQSDQQMNKSKSESVNVVKHEKIQREDFILANIPPFKEKLQK